jgi:hypothetical protein
LTRTLHTSLATPPASGSMRATSSPHCPSASHPTGDIFAEFRTSLVRIALRESERPESRSSSHVKTLGRHYTANARRRDHRIVGGTGKLLRCNDGRFCAGFSDAWMTPPSSRSDGRRPRSAKARNRGRWAPAVQWALWRFEHRDVASGNVATWCNGAARAGVMSGRGQESVGRCLGRRRGGLGWRPIRGGEASDAVAGPRPAAKLGCVARSAS